MGDKGPSAFACREGVLSSITSIDRQSEKFLMCVWRVLRLSPLEEGEGNRFGPMTPLTLEPLTFILSLCPRGEATQRTWEIKRRWI